MNRKDFIERVETELGGTLTCVYNVEANAYDVTWVREQALTTFPDTPNVLETKLRRRLYFGDFRILLGEHHFNTEILKDMANLTFKVKEWMDPKIKTSTNNVLGTVYTWYDEWFKESRDSRNDIHNLSYDDLRFINILCEDIEKEHGGGLVTYKVDKNRVDFTWIGEIDGHVGTFTNGIHRSSLTSMQKEDKDNIIDSHYFFVKTYVSRLHKALKPPTTTEIITNICQQVEELIGGEVAVSSYAICNQGRSIVLIWTDPDLYPGWEMVIIVDEKSLSDPMTVDRTLRKFIDDFTKQKAQFKQRRS